MKKKVLIKLIYISSFIIFFIGLVILLYPIISCYISAKNQTEAILEYTEGVDTIDEDEKEKMLEEANKYNEGLSGLTVTDPFIEGSGYTVLDNYYEILNVTEDGIMGYIQIPKIDCYLPIYHGTDEAVLKKGIGHVENSAFPVGGESTHTILAGHSGLTTSELFTNLTDLEEGDVFYIHVLGDILEYKIYDIEVILPEDIDELFIEKGRDLVTLVTCTPYGVNTHRLLVTGERTDYVGEETDESVNNIKNSNFTLTNTLKVYVIGILVGLGCLLIIILIKNMIEKLQ